MRTLASTGLGRRITACLHNAAPRVPRNGYYLLFLTGKHQSSGLVNSGCDTFSITDKAPFVTQFFKIHNFFGNDSRFRKPCAHFAVSWGNMENRVENYREIVAKLGTKLIENHGKMCYIIVAAAQETCFQYHKLRRREGSWIVESGSCSQMEMRSSAGI